MKHITGITLFKYSDSDFEYMKNRQKINKET